MTIPVTTRAGKGSPLTPTEMDTNLASLARDASQSVEGNIRLATPAEAVTLSDPSLAISPNTFASGMQGYGALTQFLGASVHGINGKYTTPDGTIFQWGQSSYTFSGYVSAKTVNFNTPMTNVYVVLVVGGSRGSFWPEAITNSKFDAHADGLGYSLGSGTLYWLAIGS